MPEMLLFGSVFYYSDKEYVFLGMGESGVIYAAQILNNFESSAVIRARDGALKRDGEAGVAEKPLYCFVQLKTEKYGNRIAHLNRTGEQKNQNAILQGPDDSICDDDILALRDEILDGPVPIELKELTASLDFTSFVK